MGGLTSQNYILFRKYISPQNIFYRPSYYFWGLRGGQKSIFKKFLQKNVFFNKNFQKKYVSTGIRTLEALRTRTWV